MSLNRKITHLLRSMQLETISEQTEPSCSEMDSSFTIEKKNNYAQASIKRR